MEICTLYIHTCLYRLKAEWAERAHKSRTRIFLFRRLLFIFSIFKRQKPSAFILFFCHTFALPSIKKKPKKLHVFSLESLKKERIAVVICPRRTSTKRQGKMKYTKKGRDPTNIINPKKTNKGHQPPPPIKFFSDGTELFFLQDGKYTIFYFFVEPFEN